MAKDDGISLGAFGEFMIIMMFIGVGFAVGAAAFSTPHGSFLISEGTANDICHQLTNGTSINATAEDGKLICETPSYDHTLNIIVRKAGAAE